MYHIYISHAPEDRYTAKLLRKRLTKFKLTKRDTRRFVVDSELFSEKYGNENYLIVICSLNSANCEAVGREISEFMTRFPINRIIPYVISGNPNASNENDECIPIELRNYTKASLLVIDALVLGQRKAFHRIVSTVFGIRFDELEKRMNKQLAKVIAYTAAVWLLIVGYIGYSEFTNSLRTEYYKELEYVYNIPRGVDRINLLDRLFIKDYYEFKINGKIVLSVKKHGNPHSFSSDYEKVNDYYAIIDTSNIKFSYHTDNTLDTVLYSDSDENLLFVINYAAGAHNANISKDLGGLKPCYIFTDDNGEKSFRCYYEFDENGYLKNINY